jgi:hypothetical protein
MFLAQLYLVIMLQLDPTKPSAKAWQDLWLAQNAAPSARPRKAPHALTSLNRQAPLKGYPALKTVYTEGVVPCSLAGF